MDAIERIDCLGACRKGVSCCSYIFG